MSADTPQKWTDRNAAALALVDRLPSKAQESLSIISTNLILVHNTEAYRAMCDFVAEFAPDSEIRKDKPESWGEQYMRVTFVDGVELQWKRKVRVTVVEVDEE